MNLQECKKCIHYTWNSAGYCKRHNLFCKFVRYCKDKEVSQEFKEQDFLGKSEAAVNLLLQIFPNSYDKAQILTAQAEGNKEIIVSCLNDVRHFIDEQIKELKQL